MEKPDAPTPRLPMRGVIDFSDVDRESGSLLFLPDLGPTCFSYHTRVEIHADGTGEAIRDVLQAIARNPPSIAFHPELHVALSRLRALGGGDE